MTKFIFTVTSAVATMLGQVYNENAKAVTESAKIEKAAPAANDSIRCSAKKHFRNVLVPNKKQLPS